MSRPTRLLFAIALVVALTGCSSPGAGTPGGSAVGASPATASPSSENPSAPASPNAASSTPTAEPAGSASASPVTATMVVRNYHFLEDASGGNPALVPVERTVPKSVAVARAALTTLLAGPSDSERSAKPPVVTWIPDGTELLGIEVSGGTATVDLSGTFTSNREAFAVGGRFAQVVYTLTQFPTVDRVVFRIDGTAATGFSPATRATFRDAYQPPMFVDGPAWGAGLPAGGRVAGSANVFEAQFRLAVLDAKGKTLLDRPVLATCGTGCWGTFSVTVAYHVTVAQIGTLRVWDPSEQDGSPQNVREYPVKLAP